MTLKDGLILSSAIGCEITGGVYFAFSGFVMPALAQQGGAGAAAMTDINEVILGSGFMPLFFGTTLAAVALGIMGGFDLQAKPGRLLLAGGILYLAGMFGCTVAFNVPLNDGLAAGTISRSDYVDRWTLWNSVRATASIGAAGLFAWVLIQ
ncbi:DUF1772 domain-containing protein [Devosia oryziradicis]|uniref:DUF1772 domain-containing protein n=1 Tax=Devosia oryziradicis TaxID=2801335 RepID=A0ABX7BZ69_9HYPH|nr:anthrone oxygenase family protein [Devosia oryziradicis]QQR37263.1 DUF1772 domain-containing protein [Devosia oryziradicis]